MPAQVFKDIKGYEGVYQISNLGNVKGLARIVISKSGRNYIIKEALKKLQLGNWGYYMILLSINGQARGFCIHKLVAEAFIPNPYNKKQVNHIDGNKLNNNVDNLEWCTPAENVQHAFKTGLMNPSGAKGVDNYMSRKVINLMSGVTYVSVVEAALATGIKRRTLCAQLNGQNRNKTNLVYAT